MSPTVASPPTTRVVNRVDLPYPYVGGTQHLTVLRHPQRLPDAAKFLEPELVQRTVLGSAFNPQTLSQISCPGGTVTLPPLSRGDLQEKQVVDPHNQPLGTLLRVPALYVQGNSIVRAVRQGWDEYNYDYALSRMAMEAMRLLAHVFQRGIISTRRRPGIMAHLQVESALAPDEVGISYGFARRFLRFAQEKWGVSEPWELDGLPTYTIRFPLANATGVQSLYLRVLPGTGKYIALNPWNLELKYLGDEDGDPGYLLPRLQDTALGKCMPVQRPRVIPHHPIDSAYTCVNTQSILHPEMLPVSSKLQGRFAPQRFDTIEDRLQFIKDADTRSHVAVYTMAIGWWVARTLVTSGTETACDAFLRAYECLEWFMENCMDARKGDSAMSGGGLDKHQLMNSLLRGGEIDFQTLEDLGIPARALHTLQTAYTIAGGNLREYCAQSPIYNAVVLNSSTNEQFQKALARMVGTLHEMGYQPSEVYKTVMDDLLGIQPVYAEA